MPAQVRLVVYVQPEIKRALGEEAAQRKVSQGELVRTVITGWLKRQHREQTSRVGGKV
jgi:hypothetical protein